MLTASLVLLNGGDRMGKIIKIFFLLIIVGGVVFGLIQVIPFGRQHTNPPVVSEPKWDSPQTRQIAERACFDCHSNQTIWPWYSNIAPVSWLVQRDVDEGRSRMNFSDWGTKSQNVEELVEVIQEGKMPPSQYLIMHPEARLTQAEKDTFIQGLLASLKW